MADVKWLVEDFEGDGSLQPLIETVRQLGMPCRVIKYVPFQSGKYDQYDDSECVVFYGSLNLARQLQREKAWVPGIYCNFNNLSCVTYFSHWGKYLLNDDYMMLPLLEVARRRAEVYDKFGEDGCIFMRPDSGAKTFYGNVYPFEELDAEIRLMDGYAGRPLDEILVVVSSPKPITREWRVVVSSASGPLAASQYKKDGKLAEERGCPDGVWKLAAEVSKDPWQPDPLYVVDICECWGKYFFLEVNSFSCSGYYKCDPLPIVTAASKLASEEWHEYNNEV
jgi:hypothetical protein